MQSVHVFLPVPKFYCISCDCEFTHNINKHSHWTSLRVQWVHWTLSEVSYYLNPTGGPSPSCKPSHMTCHHISQSQRIVGCICSYILWLSSDTFLYIPSMYRHLLFMCCINFKILCFKKKKKNPPNIILPQSLMLIAGVKCFSEQRNSWGGGGGCRTPPLTPGPFSTNCTSGTAGKS